MRKDGRSGASYQLVRRYFEVAGFGSERAAARLLAIEPALVECAARRLERERLVVRNLPVAGTGGLQTVLSSLIPASWKRS
jgi:hypothetical protein